MPPKGGNVTPIQPSVIQRFSGAMRGMVRGWGDAWMSPAEPVTPIAPPEVHGRQFDYPVGVNLVQRPRGEASESGIDFPTLRALADPAQGGLDLLRLAITKRKNQMEAQHWKLCHRDGSDGGDRAREIERLLRKPDLEHSFSQWQRMLLEDLLVIDAPTIYLAPSLPGKPLIPQIMDGATLKRLVRPDGRTPLPPAPAFQQVLKGIPATDYTLDELVHTPRELRSYRIYGMSPVEQVVMTVTIALRRQMSQLEYYTAGSVPDMVFGVPDTWTPDQIRQFQEWWDALLSGNTEERRRAKFVPGGVTPMMLKPEQLKDLFDEWLARIICFAFDLSPQALVKETNRSTAQTAKQSSQEEGLEPLKLWWKDTMDDVLVKAFNAPDLELAYADEEISDPVQKATVVSMATGKKAWIAIDEAREMYGKDPATPAQMEELNPAPPPPAMTAPGKPVGESGINGKPAPPAEKVAKARRYL